MAIQPTVSPLCLVVIGLRRRLTSPHKPAISVSLGFSTLVDSEALRSTISSLPPHSPFNKAGSLMSRFSTVWASSEMTAACGHFARPSWSAADVQYSYKILGE